MRNLSEWMQIVPNHWVVSLDRPPMNQRPSVRLPGKRKPQAVRHTAYVSNGETFGSAKYVSAWSDSDSLEEALFSAFYDVGRKSVALQFKPKVKS